MSIKTTHQWLNLQNFINYSTQQNWWTRCKIKSTLVTNCHWWNIVNIYPSTSLALKMVGSYIGLYCTARIVLVVYNSVQYLQYSERERERGRDRPIDILKKRVVYETLHEWHKEYVIVRALQEKRGWMKL